MLKNVSRTVIAGLVLGGLTSFSLVTAPSAAAYTTTPNRILNALTVASESNSNYDRSKFPHWLDVNKDCQNTREEVLIMETRANKAALSRSCDPSVGKWVSVYDGRTYTRASSVDIDHHVALAEAWGSGARRWNLDTRKRYANDLFGPSLSAMTPTLNRSVKIARDPGEWMPTRFQCTYVINWVKVKYRWRLSVDSREKAALQTAFSKNGCGTRSVTLPARAKITTATTSTTTSTCLIKGNISSSGEKIYHVPGGAYYDVTVIDTSAGERWFCTTQQAEDAGWRASKL